MKFNFSIVGSLLLFLIAGLILNWSPYIALILALVACVVIVWSSSKEFILTLQNRKWWWVASVWYILIFCSLAMLFSYIQLTAYSQSLGYLKYGACDSSNDFRNLAPSEISKLPDFVPLTRVSWMYFNIITLTTTGYGDICPQGDVFRTIAALEALIGMAINVILIGVAATRLVPPFSENGKTDSNHKHGS